MQQLQQLASPRGPGAHAVPIGGPFMVSSPLKQQPDSASAFKPYASPVKGRQQQQQHASDARAGAASQALSGKPPQPRTAVQPAASQRRGAMARPEDHLQHQHQQRQHQHQQPAVSQRRGAMARPEDHLQHQHEQRQHQQPAASQRRGVMAGPEDLLTMSAGTCAEQQQQSNGVLSLVTPVRTVNSRQARGTKPAKRKAGEADAYEAAGADGAATMAAQQQQQYLRCQPGRAAQGEPGMAGIKCGGVDARQLALEYLAQRKSGGPGAAQQQPDAQVRLQCMCACACMRACAHVCGFGHCNKRSQVVLWLYVVPCKKQVTNALEGEVQALAFPLTSIMMRS